MASSGSQSAPSPLYRTPQSDREADHPPDANRSIDPSSRPRTSSRPGTGRKLPRLVVPDSDSRARSRAAATNSAWMTGMNARMDDDGVDLLERRVAAERGVEDGEGEAGDDERHDRREDQLEDRPRSSARSGAILSICAYLASLTVRPNDSIWRTWLSSDAFCPTSVDRNAKVAVDDRWRARRPGRRARADAPPRRP